MADGEGNGMGRVLAFALVYTLLLWGQGGAYLQTM